MTKAAMGMPSGTVVGAVTYSCGCLKVKDVVFMCTLHLAKITRQLERQE